MTTQDGHHAGASRRAADERRRELADEAAGRFYRRGFHGVSLADVANAVGLTAPAVYRHFRNKKALLAGAIDSGLDVVDAAFGSESGSLENLLHSLAGVALERRELWVLLQREMRHLDGDELVRIQGRFADLVSRVTAPVRAARPDVDDGQLSMLVTAVLAVLASPSVSGLRLPRAEYQDILAAAASAAAHAELPEPDSGGGSVRAAESPPQSRSEELLATAIRLFHERGYAAVSLDDIGAAIGLAGPSIYHHFATKADLLVTAFTRAAHGLATRRADGDTTLEELVRGYVEVGVHQRQLFGVYVTEAINLPPEAGRRIRAELTANVDEWSAALRARRAVTEAASRVLAYAARGIVNDVVRVGKLHDRPSVATELEALALAVLDAEI
jgi:AcrR family transcriptional regulator